MVKTITVLCAAAIALSAQKSAAQFAPPLQFPPGTFQIGPYPLQCGNITTILDDSIGDSGRAVPGLILLSPGRLNSMPLVFQLFVFAHECGHHVVGLNETSADCWALRLGAQQGWIDRVGLNVIGQITISSPGDWSHMPGPQRVQAMFQCLGL